MDVEDPDIITRCFQLFQKHQEDWQDVLAQFRAKEIAGLIDTTDPEQAWHDYLDDLRALVQLLCSAPHK